MKLPGYSEKNSAISCSILKINDAEVAIARAEKRITFK